MNLTFSKKLLLSAMAVIFFDAEMRSNPKPTTLVVTNNSSATNFHFHVRVAHGYKKADGANHTNLKKGSVVKEALPYSDNKDWSEYKLYIYVWDPKKRNDGDHVIDATNGGFNITNDLSNSELHWVIQDCPRGYCAGPKH